MVNPGIPLEELVARVDRDFRRRFGRAPRWMAAAPGRVNLIGEHTDYNEGFVLPMAIERYVVMAAAPAEGPATGGDRCAVRRGPAGTFTAAPPIPAWPPGLGTCTASWSAAANGDSHAGPGCAIDSTVPLGGGLSSSAALEVATATLLEACGPKLETGPQSPPVPESGTRLRRRALRNHGPVHLGHGPGRSPAVAGLPLDPGPNGAADGSGDQGADREYECQARTDRRRIRPTPQPMRSGGAHAGRAVIAGRDAGDADAERREWSRSCFAAPGT